MVEKDLRRLLRQKWDGWIDWLEPRGNAGVGRPDVDLLHDGILVPIELKIGQCIDLKDRQFRAKIRPDQVAWQHRFYAAGGVSLFLIANSPTEMWLGRKLIMSFSGDRWLFDDCWVIDVNDLSNSLRSGIAQAK